MEQVNSDKNARKAVIANELAWHEQEAHRRFSLDTLLYEPPAFDQVVQSSFDHLQFCTGELVLDMGCGEGKETLWLAQQALLVISTDLSYQQLRRARERIEELLPDAHVCFVQANAEELPFAANSFRIIYGKAILHHLDMALSAQETKRLLQPKGRATFAEPMANHPLFWLGRQLTPRLRTQDEHPLTFKELRHFGGYFEQAELEQYFFLTPISYLFRALPRGESFFRYIHTFLHRLDQKIFRLFKPIKDLAWYGLIKLEKEEG